MIVDIEQQPDDAQLEIVCYSLVAGSHFQFQYWRDRFINKI